MCLLRNHVQRTQVIFLLLDPSLVNPRGSDAEDVAAHGLDASVVDQAGGAAPGAVENVVVVGEVVETVDLPPKKLHPLRF